MIRAFVAIPLPEPVTQALVAAQAGLPAGRPVPPENLHLTVAFLGQHPEPLIEDVHQLLDGLRAPAFALTLAGMGLFGGPRPRVLYAGVNPEPLLRHLRGKVLQAARDGGLALEHERYQPHVTVARLGPDLPAADAERLRGFAARGADFRAGPFRVAAFHLVRSILGRSGPSYDTLAAYPLAAA